MKKEYHHSSSKHKAQESTMVYHDGSATKDSSTRCPESDHREVYYRKQNKDYSIVFTQVFRLQMKDDDGMTVLVTRFMYWDGWSRWLVWHVSHKNLKRD